MSVATITAGAEKAATDIEISLTVNGAPIRTRVDARTSLADFLRDTRQLTGTHVSCEQGVCGACTLLVDGIPVRSCVTWAAACDGSDVRTIEDFDDDPTMHALREAFSREHALQCGFCTPGMLITARDVVHRHPGIDDTRLRHELAGNLCRCTGYAGIVRAVSSVANSSACSSAQLAQDIPAAATFAVFDPEQRAATEDRTAADPEPERGPIVADATGGSARISETIVVQGCEAGRLWQLLGDVPAAAGCLPGASVERFDGRELAGAVRIAFGPISARFSGVGTVEREDSSRITVIRGSGRDALSKTEAGATIEYRVAPGPVANSARLTISMEYVVQGPLAQFSRSELVRSLVGQIVREFGSNLERWAAGSAVEARPSAGLGAFGLLWRWLRSRAAALLARGH